MLKAGWKRCGGERMRSRSGRSPDAPQSVTLEDRGAAHDSLVDRLGFPASQLEI